MKRTFKIRIISKDPSKQRVPGEAPGVIATRTVSFVVDDKKNDTLLADALYKAQRDLVDDTLDVKIEEIEPERE